MQGILPQGSECCDVMGKRIISRARGKGGPPYKSPGHRFKGKPTYSFSGEAEVVDLIHDPARVVPLAKVMTEDKKEKIIIAAEGIKVGDRISTDEVKNGNILPISRIPKGSHIFGIEIRPGSGPTFCCSAGTKSIIVNQEESKVIVQLPSRKFKVLNPNCRATIGISASGGVKDKPYIKAGQVFFAKKARNKLWPRTSANKMNAVDHPFGGSTKPGMVKSVSRHASPGKKVGSIASRRTGKRKR